jgi:hypothetical protein
MQAMKIAQGAAQILHFAQLMGAFCLALVGPEGAAGFTEQDGKRTWRSAHQAAWRVSAILPGALGLMNRRLEAKEQPGQPRRPYPGRNSFID